MVVLLFEVPASSGWIIFIWIILSSYLCFIQLSFTSYLPSADLGLVILKTNQDLAGKFTPANADQRLSESHSTLEATKVRSCLKLRIVSVRIFIDHHLWFLYLVA